VIRNRHRRHVEFSDFVNQLGDTDSPIEEAVLTVEMEMNKISVLHEIFPLLNQAR
jgi:hypothetical protein